MRTTLALVVLSCVLLPACKEEPPGPTPEQMAQQHVQRAYSANRGDGAAGAPTTVVQVAAEGTRFEPPVRVENLPADVWYCDMGTVHYAATAKGDGRCPVCGMNLTHR